MEDDDDHCDHGSVNDREEDETCTKSDEPSGSNRRSTKTFCDLDHYAIVAVFKYLDPDSLLRCMEVCRK